MTDRSRSMRSRNVDVIQSDREFAARAYNSPGMVKPILAGRHDGLPFVQICAEYRLFLAGETEKDPA